MTPTEKKMIKKIIIVVIAIISFFITATAAMVCIASGIVYGNNKSVILGVATLIVVVPIFSILTWKEVYAYAEKL